MKHLKILLTLVFCANVLIANPKIVDINIDSIFVPVGFDDNDEIVFVLDGYLPDSCHRIVQPSWRLDKDRKTILVSQQAEKYKGDCLEIVVPFTTELSIGKLNVGHYVVRTEKGKEVIQPLEVRRSPNWGPDDYLYAPIDRARVEYPSGFRWVGVLEGRFTNTCLSIKEVKVTKTGRTLQVLPVMEFGKAADDCSPCRAIERAFRVEVELPFLDEEARYLLHVRSLHGRAANSVFHRTPINE